MTRFARWTKTIVAAAVMAVVAVSCGSVKNPVRQPSTQANTSNPVLFSPLSTEDSLRYNYFFLEAIREQNAGHYDAAFDLLRHSLEINPNAAEAWYYMSMYQSEMNQDSLAMKSLEKASAINPDNDTYQERLGRYFLSNQEFDKAKKVYERLANNNRSRSDVLQILLQLYQQDKDYDGMLWAINRLEEIEGQREEITLSKMRIYEMKGDKKSAWKTLKSLSDEHPSDVNYRVMMGNWLMQNERQKEAFKIFSDALQEEPENAYVQSSMYDYYRSSGQDSLARQMMRSIILSPRASTESKSVMMRQAIQENEEAGGDSTAILQLFDEMLVVNPKDSDMAEMKVAYMSLKQMPPDSINVAIEKLLAISPENVGARTQLLGTYLRKMDWDAVIGICHDGTLYNPDEMVFYYYEGLAYYQQDKRDEALETFQRGVSQINSESNAEIVADFYYFMGDILHQKEREREAFAAYDSCLQWKPDHISCLNNYAYFLAVRGEDLERAEQMSFKTVKEEPENTNNLDTYAWILFRQDRFAEAKIYIDQALKIELAKIDSVAVDTVSADEPQQTEEQQADDSLATEEDETLEVDSIEADTLDAADLVPSAVVLEHAGDIYYKTGNVERALELWALALEITDDRFDIIEEKIRKKKYIEDN
ncbi:MAG: hypothetical protein K6C10_09090 [Prevotella sp.]|nr:hypothetical protein [Prevotella sp.]